ncbi:pyruvate kinase [Sutterella sp. CAG:397]|nr:pyruvate kinase [Sutterella sp. CAG:397]
MANDVHAKAIVVNTLSGKTARMVSRFRPAADIVGFTTSEKTWRKLALSWGVTPQLSPVYDGITSMFTATAQETKKLLGLKAGDKIVLTGGLTDGTSGNTDLVKIQTM